MARYSNPNDALCHAFNNYSHQHFLKHRNGPVEDNDHSLAHIYAHSMLPFLKPDEVLISQDTRLKHNTLEELQEQLAQFGVTLSDIQYHEKNEYGHSYIAKLHTKNGLDMAAKLIEETWGGMHYQYYQEKVPDTVQRVGWALEDTIEQLVPVCNTETDSTINTLEQHARETLLLRAQTGFDRDSHKPDSFTHKALPASPTSSQLQAAFEAIDSCIDQELLMAESYIGGSPNKILRESLEQQLKDGLKQLSTDFILRPQHPQIEDLHKAMHEYLCVLPGMPDQKNGMSCLSRTALSKYKLILHVDTCPSSTIETVTHDLEQFGLTTTNKDHSITIDLTNQPDITATLQAIHEKTKEFSQNPDNKTGGIKHQGLIDDKEQKNRKEI